MKSYKEVIIQVLVVITFVVLMTAIAVGVAQKKAELKQENNEVYIEQEEDNNVITINTTIMNAIDKSIDLNTIRIEQMFVIDTYIDDDTNESIVVLEDTKGQVWEYLDMGLGMEEEVLVLMSDNNTQDIADDLIIHFWSSLE